MSLGSRATRDTRSIDSCLGQGIKGGKRKKNMNRWAHVEEALFRVAASSASSPSQPVEAVLAAADVRATAEYRRLGRVLYRIRNSHRAQLYCAAAERLYRELSRLG